jgi:phosphoribosyl 1,2-cyclic phosphodiesterase
MRFASLGSGSRGNATLIESGSTLVMVDCGFSRRETERRLARLGRSAAQLAALLVTHEHGDHIRGVCALARQYDLPVWLSAGTRLMLREDSPPGIHCIDAQAGIRLGDLEVLPFTVPHDAREPCQFVFADGNHRFGLLTDTGRITAHIRDCLDGCDALMLECNHDPAMLAGGPYSASLKARVGGPLGHLSNAQAAGLLARRTTSPGWPARRSPRRSVAHRTGSAWPGRRPGSRGARLPDFCPPGPSSIIPTSRSRAIPES